MKFTLIFFYLILIWLIVPICYSAINNTDYESDIILSSGGTENSSSSSYYSQAVISIPAYINMSNNDYLNDFGFFYISETTTTTQPPSQGAPSGDAGGRGRTRLNKAFIINESVLKIELTPGDIGTKKISIKSVGNSPANIHVDKGVLAPYVITDKEIITLGIGLEEELQFVFVIPRDLPPGIYHGIIRFREENVNINDAIPLIVIIDVKEKTALFDLDLESDKSEFFIGDAIEAIAHLLNLGDLRPVDVNLYYALRGIEGEDIISEVKTYAVDNKLDVPVSLKIPSYVKPGKYLLYGELRYQNTTAYSSILISAIEKPIIIKSYNIINWILILIAILILLIVIYLVRRKLQERKKQNKPKVKPIIKKEVKIKREPFFKRIFARIKLVLRPKKISFKSLIKSKKIIYKQP